MSSVAEVYAYGVLKQLKYYYAQWLPNAKIDLGTVGELENKCFFRPVSTLAALGIDFSSTRDVLEDPDPTPFNLVSASGVIMETKIAGELSSTLKAIAVGKAGIGIEFSKEGAFVVIAKEAYEPRIQNLARLEKDIFQAYQDGRWKRNYVLVSSLVKSPYADIIISQSSQASVELEVGGGIQLPQVELGNVEISFSVKRQSGTILNMLNSKNVTPIFQLSGLKRKWFSLDFSHLSGFKGIALRRTDVEDQPLESTYFLGNLSEPDLDSFLSYADKP